MRHATCNMHAWTPWAREDKGVRDQRGCVLRKHARGDALRARYRKDTNSVLARRVVIAAASKPQLFLDCSAATHVLAGGKTIAHRSHRSRFPLAPVPAHADSHLHARFHFDRSHLAVYQTIAHLVTMFEFPSQLAPTHVYPAAHLTLQAGCRSRRSAVPEHTRVARLHLLRVAHEPMHAGSAIRRNACHAVPVPVPFHNMPVSSSARCSDERSGAAAAWVIRAVVGCVW